MTLPDLPEELPGSERIADGLADFTSGNVTIASCLLAIGEPRLRRAGLELPSVSVTIRDPEHRLYQLLGRQPGDAYSLYNSLLRRLISLEHALDHRAARSRQNCPPSSPPSVESAKSNLSSSPSAFLL